MFLIIFVSGLPCHAAIQYTDFGPATLNTDDSMVFVTGLNQFISFGWAQPVPSVRTGIFEFTGTGASLLTDANGIVVLDEGDSIDAEAGNWTTPTGAVTLWERSVFTGFNSSYLTPGNTGIIPLRFSEGGSLYYGWVEITDLANDGSSYTVSAFAFNNQPDAPILSGQSEDPPPPPGSVIPEPSTLLLLAFGVIFLSSLRGRSVGSSH